MKWIAALLLIVNVALYLWSSEQNVTVEQASLQAQPDVNRESMALLSEVRPSVQADTAAEAELDGLPVAAVDEREPVQVSLGEGTGEAGEDAGEIASTAGVTDNGSDPLATAAPEALLPADTADPASPAAESALFRDLMCFRIGPFRSAAAWEDARNWMDEQDFAYRTVRSESRELRAIRVFLGPFETLEATRPVIQELKEKDLENFAYMRDDGKARISLGYFTQEELATKFVDYLNQRNVAAQSEPLFRSIGPFDWMEATIDGRRESLLRTRQWSDSGASSNRVECDTVRAGQG